VKVIPPFVFSSYRRIRQLLWCAFYVGNDILCPFCGGRFRKFMPVGKYSLVPRNVVGAGERTNCICPRCESTDRERHVFLYLKQRRLLNVTPRTRMLHVAPENNLGKILASTPNVEYISGDLYPERLGAMVKIDITHIEYLDNYFDAIICNHVLEHIVDDIKAMRELSRVLKPEGWAILQVPLDSTRSRTFEDSSIITPSERLKKFGQRDHVRIYGKDYVFRLQQSGFEVIVDRSLTQNDNVTQKHGLIREEPIFFCRKVK